MIFNNDPGLEFIAPDGLSGSIPEPTPLKKHIPDWFKKIPAFRERDASGFPALTAKKCLPLVDAMSLGWVIPLQADLHVITNDDCSIINAKPREGCPISVVERHSWGQVSSEKWTGYKQDPLKFINHWIIKTKPGWSCLFQALPNVLQQDFMCLSGVVDTDRYHNMINFPAVWLKANADVTLPAGTPLVQVIPFKRNEMKAVIRDETEKEAKKREKLGVATSSRISVYTKELREVR